MNNRMLKSAGLAGLLAMAGFGLWTATSVDAADHAEAPGTATDAAADIADFYSWHTEDDTVVSIVTFAPLLTPGTPAVYDEAVLYSLHQAFPNKEGTFDDFDADASAHVRFGQDAAGDWGVQATLVSALGEIVIEGPVGEPLTDDSGIGITVWAGLADDPFFFDSTGFADTIASETLAFDPTRDSLAGTNVTAIVLEAPLFSPLMKTWATTGRDNG